MRTCGVQSNPPCRFERLRRIPPGAEPGSGLESEPEAAPPDRPTRYLYDPSRSIVATNESPDVGFDASVNPYRGCSHGCAYCYARPHHEFLGFSAGLDFETRILVKLRAPELLAQRLAQPSWRPQVIGLSGVTDPYQPAERRFRITRGCLEVLARFRNPTALVTKSALVTRDLDLLTELARFRGVSVVLSVTTLDTELQRRMEPRASSPRGRLAAIARLAGAGVPVGVNVAPVIPGLTDHEIPAILAAASAAGASFAGMIMLRLPHGVKTLFDEWLGTHEPGRRLRVRALLREMRGGQLDDSRFGTRGRGEGPYAQQLRSLFALAARRAGLAMRGPALSTEHFGVPGRPTQLDLFGATVLRSRATMERSRL